MRTPEIDRDDDELSTVLQQKFDPSPVPDRSFVLVVVEGPDAGKRLEIGAHRVGRLLLGQSPACELRLADREVSRRHAAFEWIGKRLRVTDLESRNGTFVDHVAIGAAFLQGGEIVRVGATALRVEHERGGARANDSSAGDPLTALSTATRFGRTMGASREMRALYPYCERIAASNIPLLIEGETGTGKEVLAESIHEEGPRASGPFVVFDCTAVPPNLVESELFGHERGAFTGAVATRKGVFEQAEGGTLLIDEIGDLDVALQPKLLRVLERSEIRRVGGDRWIKVDVRIVSATRRDLDHEVQAGRFRDDLFHRLAVARIELPPLRRRRGDVPMLARHFAEQLGGRERAASRALPSEVLARWDEMPWPGNVRELRNAVARQLTFGDWTPPSAGDVDATGAGDDAATAPAPADGDVVAEVLARRLPLVEARRTIVEAFERRYIAQVLAENGGNVVRAAAASGIARRYFQILKARGR